ncbi:hypothetical protein C8R43DRAFT_1238079 [Mycena crocata]|nr:hypothetical protein C8R43DRAFT_1238079 [Mycena crocata]
MPLTELDPARLERASKLVCELFGVGPISAPILDIPTGGGKTLALWFALFYYWEPGNVDEACQKILLVVGPLTALMQSQANDLISRGVPAVAITSDSHLPVKIQTSFSW